MSYYDREKQELKPVRIVMSSVRNSGNDNRVEFGNLLPEEHAMLKLVEVGGGWVRVNDQGRLEVYERYHPLPSPIHDPEMAPHWDPPVVARPAKQLFFDFCTPDAPFEPERHVPRILVKYLCGYNYTPERYKRCAQFMLDVGFTCLRSPRSDDGRYSESWELCSLLPKGELAEHVKDVPRDQRFKTMVHWLIHNIPFGFGTMDVTVQRCCMTVD